MRRFTAGLGSLAVAAGLATTVALSSASAVPPEGSFGQPIRAQSDELPNPVEAKRRELREAALQKVLKGEAKVQNRNGSKVVKVGETQTTTVSGTVAQQDQYVELQREKTDKIFVILAEFGNERDPSYPDKDTDPNTPGPDDLRTGRCTTRSPQPDRAKDNSTVWQADYNRQHYQDLYFGTGEDSLRTYYEKQSSGATASTARSRTGSRSATTRPATAAPTATPAPATSARTPGT